MSLLNDNNFYETDSISDITFQENDFEIDHGPYLEFRNSKIKKIIILLSSENRKLKYRLVRKENYRTFFVSKIIDYHDYDIYDSIIDILFEDLNITSFYINKKLSYILIKNYLKMNPKILSTDQDILCVRLSFGIWFFKKIKPKNPFYWQKLKKC